VPRRKREPGAPKKKRVAQPTAQGIVERLQRQRDEVLRFMTDLSVPFDNNGSERELRMIKLQQKISGCFRTPDGARNFCRVRSYLSTARKQGHSLLCSSGARAQRQAAPLSIRTKLSSIPAKYVNSYYIS
jgi:transposase